MHTPNQTWIVARGGQVIAKKSKSGISTLTDLERLIYCLYETDYMMRNAGDFANAPVMYPNFQKDAQRFAKSLGLKKTHEAFSLSQRKLQREYFNRFEDICDEIKRADECDISVAEKTCVTPTATEDAPAQQQPTDSICDHPRIRSAAVGIATVLVFLISMLLWMHGCDLCSLWIQVPLFAGMILIVPAWARQATTLGTAMLRSVLIILVSLGLVIAYLEWLHSTYFPHWLLFPKL